MAVLYESAVTVNREDITDIIKNISPVESWFFTNIGTSKAKGVYHEWPQDELSSPTAENAVAEGSTPSYSALTPPTRTGNFTQILRVDGSLSMTQEAVSSAGYKSDLKYQVKKESENLAQDIEYMLVINPSSNSGTGSATRKSKGLRGWITTNVTTGTGTGSEALTESMFNDNIGLIWAQGGKPSNVICGWYQKRKMDAFTGISSSAVQIAAEKNKIISNIRIYESSAGTLMVHLHHLMNTNAASEVIVLGQMDCWMTSWLRRPMTYRPSITGSFYPFFLEAEGCLEARQQKSSGKITQLSTS